MKLKVVNFYGGPGTGKSTMAMDVTAHLKWAGVNAEYVSEYAKDCVWQEDRLTLKNQVAILGEQTQRLLRLAGKVDVAITDSPILLSIIYAKEYGCKWLGSDFAQMTLKMDAELFDSLSIFLLREKPFVQAGRVQTREEAELLDCKIEATLLAMRIPYITRAGNADEAERIMHDVYAHMGVKSC